MSPIGIPDQIRAVRNVLAQAERPVAADELARAFKGGKKRKERVTELLESLSLLGQVREDAGRPSSWIAGNTVVHELIYR